MPAPIAPPRVICRRCGCVVDVERPRLRLVTETWPDPARLDPAALCEPCSESFHHWVAEGRALSLV